MTTSLVREELLDAPAAPSGDPAVDAPLAALLAGEPRRALALLGQHPPSPRSTAALRAWALHLDRNWYPGEVGGEVELEPEGAFVRPQQTGDPVEDGLEALTTFGPNGVRTPRTLVELSLRMGAVTGVQQAVGAADRALADLAHHARLTGQPGLQVWANLAGADVHHRAGDPGHAAFLQAARDQARALGDRPRLARTFLAEGDWAAAPGSSPEAIGWDLAPQTVPSPLGTGDLGRAALAWDRAEQLLAGLDLPRFRSALALRRSLLARAAGDEAARRELLGQALAHADRAGDTAGHHLVAIHALVADIDAGLLGTHQLDLGGGWHRPARGPVADLLGWAETVGSRSWCVGLGRLLQRCGDAWQRLGSAPRSRVAHLAALQLISTAPAVPADTLHTAVSNAESRLNLSASALLRLERAFGRRFTDTDDTDRFGFAQKLEASMVMVQAFRARARGAAAGVTADRMVVLRDQLEGARAAMAASIGPADGPVPRSMDELQAAIGAMQQDGSLEDSAALSEKAVTLMVRTQVEMARAQVDLLDVLVSLARAAASTQAGRQPEAARWYDAAVARARAPGVEPWLLPLALIQAGRREEAAGVLATSVGSLPDDLLLPLFVRVDDTAAALAALERLRSAGRPLDDWSSLLTIAELHLAEGDATGARESALAGIDAFARSIATVLRDPDRLDACDQPDVVALHSTLALAEQRLGDDAAAFEAAESVRRLVVAEQPPDDPGGLWAGWQRAAAEYAAVTRTALRTDLGGPAEEVDAVFARLDDADGRLMRAEQALDQAQPGSLLRRAVPRDVGGLRELQQSLPDGVVVLTYLTVGDDLLAWAVTRDGLTPHHAGVRERDVAELVRTVHAGCAEGHAPPEPAQHLADLLLGPFTAVLADHRRVVVVGFASLHVLPFHALPHAVGPLGRTHVVSYARTAAEAATSVADRPVAASRALVVGDPAFDPAAHPSLAPLPGSRVEAAAVAAALGAVDPLVGEDATEAAVAARLEECDLLHISSHGHLDDLSPFASSLVMAGPDELTVAELVGLRFETTLAVLTGCDTGRGTATLGGDVIGLTRALLEGGVRLAVVSLWPVDDVVAPVVMSHFYARLAAGDPPARALADAQAAVRALDAAALRAAYVALGGSDTNARRRRGVELDPELRDDEDVPEELGGDAERYWAPFVLIG